MGAFLDHLGRFPVHSGRIQRNNFISLAFLVGWVRESWAQTAEHTGIFRHLKCFYDTRTLWNRKHFFTVKPTLPCPANNLPADWGFCGFLSPQHEFKSCALLPYFHYPLHKWSSCIKSDLGWVHNTGHLHSSTPFRKPAGFFMLQNHLWTSRAESSSSSTSSCNRCVLSTWNYAAEPISPWPLQSAPAQGLTEMINQPPPSSNLRKCLSKSQREVHSQWMGLFACSSTCWSAFLNGKAKGSPSVTLEIHQVSRLLCEPDKL